MDDIVEKLRDPDYAGALQHLRSSVEIDRLFNAAADRIETYQSDADAHVSRLERLRRQEDEIRDLKAERDTLRSDNARLAKELEEARKPIAWATQPIAGGMMWLTDLKAQSERWEREGHHIIALVPAQSAAIRHKATVTTDDLPEGGQGGD